MGGLSATGWPEQIWHSLFEMYIPHPVRIVLHEFQVAALVGVHTLGRMHLVNSGYRGVWVDEEGIYDMDNEFYKVLFDEALTWKKYARLSSSQLDRARKCLSEKVYLGDPGQQAPAELLVRRSPGCVVYAEQRLRPAL